MEEKEQKIIVKEIKFNPLDKKENYLLIERCYYRNNYLIGSINNEESTIIRRLKTDKSLNNFICNNCIFGINKDDILYLLVKRIIESFKNLFNEFLNEIFENDINPLFLKINRDKIIYFDKYEFKINKNIYISYKNEKSSFFYHKEKDIYIDLTNIRFLYKNNNEVLIHELLYLLIKGLSTIEYKINDINFFNKRNFLEEIFDKELNFNLYINDKEIKLFEIDKTDHIILSSSIKNKKFIFKLLNEDKNFIEDYFNNIYLKFVNNFKKEIEIINKEIDLIILKDNLKLCNKTASRIDRYLSTSCTLGRIIKKDDNIKLKKYINNNNNQLDTLYNKIYIKKKNYKIEVNIKDIYIKDKIINYGIFFEPITERFRLVYKKEKDFYPFLLGNINNLGHICFGTTNFGSNLFINLEHIEKLFFQSLFTLEYYFLYKFKKENFLSSDYIFHNFIFSKLKIQKYNLEEVISLDRIEGYNIYNVLIKYDRNRETLLEDSTFLFFLNNKNEIKKISLKQYRKILL